MKPPVIVGILIVVAALVVGGVKFNEHSKRQAVIGDVKSTYAALLNAYDSGDSETALKLLTDRSIEMYGGILQQALNANETQTKSLPASQMIEVFTARSKGTRKELRNLDGRGFVAHAVKNGWWRQEDRLRIEDVKLNGAWGDITLVDGEWADAHRDQRVQNFLGSSRRLRSLRSNDPKIPAPPRLLIRVVNDNGTWKVCEASSASSVDAYIRSLAQIEGLKESEFVTMMFDEDEDGKLDPKLLRAMK